MALKKPSALTTLCRRHPQWYFFVQTINCVQAWKAVRYEMFKDGRNIDTRISVFRVFYSDVMHCLISQGQIRLAFDITKEHFVWLLRFQKSYEYVRHILHCMMILSELTKALLSHSM